MSYVVKVRGKKRCPNPLSNPDCDGYCSPSSRTCRNCSRARITARNKIRILKGRLGRKGKHLTEVHFRIANDFDISRWDPDTVDEPMVKFVVEELLKR